MSTDTEHALPPNPLPPAAVTKFYALNDDLDAVQNITRRVFFEFLRTKPELTANEIEMLWSVSDLLSDLATEKRKAA